MTNHCSYREKGQKMYQWILSQNKYSLDSDFGSRQAKEMQCQNEKIKIKQTVFFNFCSKTCFLPKVPQTTMINKWRTIPITPPEPTLWQPSFIIVGISFTYSI